MPKYFFTIMQKKHEDLRVQAEQVLKRLKEEQKKLTIITFEYS